MVRALGQLEDRQLVLSRRVGTWLGRGPLMHRPSIHSVSMGQFFHFFRRRGCRVFNEQKTCVFFFCVQQQTCNHGLVIVTVVADRLQIGQIM